MDYNRFNIQFYHSIQPRDLNSYTVSVEVPPKEAFEELLKLGTDKWLWINVGKTTLHPKDRYVKKTGREVSLRNNIRQKYMLTSCEYFEDCILIQLTGNHYAVTGLQFRLFNNASKAHLIYAV